MEKLAKTLKHVFCFEYELPTEKGVQKIRGTCTLAGGVFLTVRHCFPAQMLKKLRDRVKLRISKSGRFDDDDSDDIFIYGGKGRTVWYSGRSGISDDVYACEYEPGIGVRTFDHLDGVRMCDLLASLTDRTNDNFKGKCFFLRGYDRNSRSTFSTTTDLKVSLHKGTGQINLQYDCSTDFGCSGGPIIEGLTGMIVGVHSYGVTEGKGSNGGYGIHDAHVASCSKFDGFRNKKRPALDKQVSQPMKPQLTKRVVTTTEKVLEDMIQQWEDVEEIQEK